MQKLGSVGHTSSFRPSLFAFDSGQQLGWVMVSWMTSIWPATDSVSEPFNSTFTLGLGNATHLQTCVLKFGCSRIAFHYYSGASLLQSLAGFCCVPFVSSEMHEVVAITCWVRGQICGRTHCACWFWVFFFPPPHTWRILYGHSGLWSVGTWWVLWYEHQPVALVGWTLQTWSRMCFSRKFW